MGIITRAHSDIGAGDTILSAHINDGLNTIYDEFNGNIDNSNIVDGAGIAISKTALGTYTTWTDFAVTWTATGVAPAIGNGTITARYCQIGKTVTYQIHLDPGNTTTFGTGAWFFNAPVAPTANAQDLAVGSAHCLDSGTGYFAGVTKFSGTSLYAVGSGESDGTQWGQNSPMTWVDADSGSFSIIYEVA